MNSRYFVCEDRELHCTEWGAQQRETVPEQFALVERFFNGK